MLTNKLELKRGTYKYFKIFLKFIWPFVFKVRKLIYPLHLFHYEQRLKSNYTSLDETCLEGLIIIFDNNFEHGGLVDKMKGIVSAYYLSKVAKIEFYIYFSDDNFHWLSIIDTSNVNLIEDKSKLSFSRKCSDPVVWYNFTPNFKKYILYRIKKKKQIHLYCNINILPIFNNLSNEMQNEWAINFNKIFKFKNKLFINNQINPRNKIGIHLRFVDLFGDFDDLRKTNYSNEYRNSCLNWCVQVISDLFYKYNGYIFLIVSDSKYFLDFISDMPFVFMNSERFIINSKSIGHIFINKDKDVFIKSVSDFFSLSLCSKIFQIRYQKMHNSDFSRYASFVNNSDFELLEN